MVNCQRGLGLSLMELLCGSCSRRGAVSSVQWTRKSTLRLLARALSPPEDTSPRPFSRTPIAALRREHSSLPGTPPLCFLLPRISYRDKWFPGLHVTPFETVGHFCFLPSFPLEISFVPRLLILPLECLPLQLPSGGAAHLAPGPPLSCLAGVFQ